MRSPRLRYTVIPSAALVPVIVAAGAYFSDRDIRTWAAVGLALGVSNAITFYVLAKHDSSGKLRW